MSVNVKLLRAVEHFLDGTARPSDFSTIFLVLREYNFSRESVKEIGDATAHSVTRDRGISTKRVRDHAAVIRGIAPLVLTVTDVAWPAPTIDEFKDALPAQLRLHPSIATSQRLRPEVAKSVLGSALKKIDALGRDGSLRMKPNATRRECELIDGLKRVFGGPVAFTSDELFDDLGYVLEKNRAIQSSDVGKIEPYRDALAIFALHTLNGSSIKLSESLELPLTLSIGENVSVAVVHQHPKAENLKIILSVFATTLPPQSVFEPATLALIHAAAAAPSSGQVDLSRMEISDEFKLRTF